MNLNLLASTLRVATPLVFAALGGLLSERAGVINIALEGLMLVGAFASGAATFASHSPWIGMLAGMAAGILLAAVYALLVIRLRANQIVAGVGINMLAFGLTPFMCKLLYDVTGSTPMIPLKEKFQIAPAIICWVGVVGIYWWLKRTGGGLWLSFAGENPEALQAAGVGVDRVRWFAVLGSGALAGLGGVALSIYLSSSFSRNMTAGRGFMALAALIFGKWKPIPAALACLFFALSEAVQIRLQGTTIAGKEVPVQFVQILPYVVTILVLAGFVGRARPPKALGKRTASDNYSGRA